MQRRDFIKKIGLTTAGAFVAPYILPSGRLFASTGNVQSSQHVVLVMFAGGVRQQESVLQGYLNQSQGLGASHAGNIMTNIMTGAAPNLKVVYGTGAGGISPIPSVLGSTLQSQGTLFKEVKALTAGHYGGWSALLQGNNVSSQGLKQKPLYPTIFEYLRRHGGFPASKVWFVGNTIGSSLPLLNYSEHANYGAKYGANFFAPLVTFGTKGQEFLSDAKVYHPADELPAMYKMKFFLDNNFSNIGASLPDLHNTEAEKQDIKAFMKSMYSKTTNNTVAMPPVSQNGDARTVGYTCELLKWFKPNLTVVTLSNVDGCHSNFTDYLGALHRADHAVGHLWNYIQTQIPSMANNTTMIVSPECGRDLTPNVIKDTNEWRGYDHSDSNSRRVFTSIVGPGVPQNHTVGSDTNPVGFNTDVVPTIAEILGIKSDVMGAGFLYPGTQSLFDQM